MATKSGKETPRDALRPGTLIEGLRIKKTIGQGGFSLIYLAEDEDTRRHLAVKEYLPKKYGMRNGSLSPVTFADEGTRHNFLQGLKLFYQESKILAELDHPHVVKVRSCFRSNNTGYLGMDYHPGKNLGAYIKRRKGNLSSHFILSVFVPLLDALNTIHKHAHLHLDFKPSNVHLKAGGSPLLLDFGAVYHFVGKMEPNTHVITPGFSPIEQHQRNGKVGPWTDIYAVGASMRSCIEGKPPLKAADRIKEDKMEPLETKYKNQYPAHLLQAIDWAMAIKPHDRPQSAMQFSDALTGNRPVPQGANKEWQFRHNQPDIA